MTRSIEESQRINTELRDTTTKKVKPKTILPGDLVCKKLEAVKPIEARGALPLKWEEPVRVLQALGNGAYKLETLDGELIPRTWNADNLQE